MRSALVLVLAIGCNGREPAPAVTNPGPPVVAPAPTPVAPTNPVVACTPASFATQASCDVGDCFQLYEVSATCEVRKVHEAPITMGGAVVVDIAWPAADGPLYAVAQMSGTGEYFFATIASPRTFTEAKADKIDWKKPKHIGAPDPEGHQFGIEDDRGSPVLTGCADWIRDVGPGQEPWSCTQRVFRKLDGTRVKTPPMPAHVTAWKAGEVVPGIELRMTTQLECRTGSDAWQKIEAPAPIGLATAGTRYFLVIERGGSHSQGSNIRANAIAMTGCAPDPELAGGDIAIGPGGLHAHRSDATTPWLLYRPGSSTPLVALDANELVFTR